MEILRRCPAISDFGLKIGVEGEREFKAALADINQYVYALRVVE